MNEIYERDAVPALVKLLEEEYTNPLNKELAVSVLSSIQKVRVLCLFVYLFFVFVLFSFLLLYFFD